MDRNRNGDWISETRVPFPRILSNYRLDYELSR